MLTNKIYIGNMVQGKYGSISYKSRQNKPRPKSGWYRVENTHDAIIDRDLWNRAQAMIVQRAKPFEVGTVGLFARKVRCVNCGYTMRSSKNRGRHYLQCSNRHVSKDACIGAFISVEKLERIVIGELNRLSAEYLDEDELEQKVDFCDNMETQKKRLSENRAVYKKRVSECAKCIRELYLDKVKGIISESDFVDMSWEFSVEKERLEYQISNVNMQLKEVKKRIADGDNRRAMIEQYTNLEHLTREMVEIMIGYITVGKRKQGEKYPSIKIHWNF